MLMIPTADPPVNSSASIIIFHGCVAMMCASHVKKRSESVILLRRRSAPRCRPPAPACDGLSSSESSPSSNSSSVIAADTSLTRCFIQSVPPPTAVVPRLPVETLSSPMPLAPEWLLRTSPARAPVAVLFSLPSSSSLLSANRKLPSPVVQQLATSSTPSSRANMAQPTPSSQHSQKLSRK